MNNIIKENHKRLLQKHPSISKILQLSQQINKSSKIK